VKWTYEYKPRNYVGLILNMTLSSAELSTLPNF